MRARRGSRRAAARALQAAVLAALALAGFAVAADGVPGLSIDDSPDPVAAGGSLTYDLHVTGPTDTVELYDTVPAGAELVSSECGEYSAPVYRCVIFGLAPGEVATRRVVIRPTQAGSIVNEAHIEQGGAELARTTATTDVLPDLPTLAIADVTVGEGDAGTTAAIFDVTLSRPSTSTVTVGFATADGSARAGEDYVAAAGTLTFAPGETAARVTVLVTGDTTDEPDESFLVTLLNPDGATLAGSGAGHAEIVDDDVPAEEPVPAVSVADATVAEGSAGTTAATVVVSRAPAAGTTTVRWTTVDGSATAPSDYAAAAGTLTFAAGESSKTISLAVVGDALDEPDEAFSIELSQPSAGSVVGDGEATVTIVDDDVAAAADVSLAVSGPASGFAGTTLGYDVTVANAGPDATPAGATFVLVATLAAADGTSFPPLAVAGATCAASTYEAFGIATTTNECPLAPLAAGASVTFHVTTPASRPGQLLLGAASGNLALDGKTPIGAGTHFADPVAANDLAQVTTTIALRSVDLEVVSLAAPPVAPVGDAVPVTATVRNDGPDPVAWPGAALVFSGVTLLPGSPCTPAPGLAVCPLDLAAGATAEVAISHYRLAATFGTDTITARVTTDVGSLPGGAGVAKLADDPVAANDTASVTVGYVPLAIDSASVVEGDAGSSALTFTLRLGVPGGGGILFPLAVPVQTSADPGTTATPGTDYATTTTTVLFAPGATTATVTVPVAGDAECEPDETLVLYAVGPGSGTPLVVGGSTPVTGVGTILDDDGTCATGSVGPGGSVTTDGEGDGATPAEPVEATVTSPVAGAISIRVRPAVSSPTAFTFLGRTVDIEAPAATAADPLTLTFLLDSSLVPSSTGTPTVFRNGVAVAPCLPSAGTTAAPDPCLASVAVVGGDVRLTVRTSHASTWTFGEPVRDTGTVTGPGFVVRSRGGRIDGELAWGRFHARSFVALALRGPSAWFAGVGRDGRPFLAHVEDAGKGARGDVYELWIAGELVTGMGRAHGNVHVAP